MKNSRITFLLRIQAVNNLHKLISSMCTGDNLIGPVLASRLFTNHRGLFACISKSSVKYMGLNAKILLQVPWRVSWNITYRTLACDELMSRLHKACYLAMAADLFPMAAQRQARPKISPLDYFLNVLHSLVANVLPILECWQSPVSPRWRNEVPRFHTVGFTQQVSRQLHLHLSGTL